jgi:hypothetical protein
VDVHQLSISLFKLDTHIHGIREHCDEASRIGLRTFEDDCFRHSLGDMIGKKDRRQKTALLLSVDVQAAPRVRVSRV